VEESTMAITLTENAAAEVKKVMEEQKMDDVLLRVGVAGGGCSGFSYSLGFDKAFDEQNDVKTEHDDGEEEDPGGVG